MAFGQHIGFEVGFWLESSELMEDGTIKDRTESFDLFEDGTTKDRTESFDHIKVRVKNTGPAHVDFFYSRILSCKYLYL